MCTLVGSCVVRENGLRVTLTIEKIPSIPVLKNGTGIEGQQLRFKVHLRRLSTPERKDGSGVSSLPPRWNLFYVASYDPRVRRNGSEHYVIKVPVSYRLRWWWLVKQWRWFVSRGFRPLSVCLFSRSSPGPSKWQLKMVCKFPINCG